MVHKTKAVVLRTVKFGETSLVVSAFTELFGLQSYIVNNVRTVSKKGASKGVYFQPAALLELVAYHNDFKNLQRIKEYKWSYLYNEVFSHVFKNAVCLYLIELLSKCLKEPEPAPELFYFVEDALQGLDNASPAVMANYPIFFALHLAYFFGFRIADEPVAEYIDLAEGAFTDVVPRHPHYLEGKEAAAVSQILKVQQPAELQQIKLTRDDRQRILTALESYYALHLPDFGHLKTGPVLRELLS